MLDIVEDFLDTHPDINYMTPEDCQAYIAAQTGQSVYIKVIEAVFKMRIKEKSTKKKML